MSDYDETDLTVYDYAVFGLISDTPHTYSINDLGICTKGDNYDIYGVAYEAVYEAAKSIKSIRTQISIPESINSDSVNTFTSYNLSSLYFSKSDLKTYIADDKQLGLVVDTNEYINASFVFLNNTRVRFTIKNKPSYKKVLIQGELYLDKSIQNKDSYLFYLYSLFNNNFLEK